MAGYRAAGDRAIRIDMLERLADMLRERDSKGGFEAAPEMLSITGLPLEAFAQLMAGLGYRAERGERPKVKVQRGAAAVVAQGPEVPETVPEVPEVVPEVPEVVPQEMPVVPEEMPESVPVEVPGDPGVMPEMEAEAVAAEAVAAAQAVASDAAAVTVAETAPDAPVAEVAAEVQAGPVETEFFYLFTWAGRGQRRERGERPRGDRRPARAPEAAPVVEGAPAEARPPRENRPPRKDRPRDGQPREGQAAGEPRAERQDRGPRPQGKPQGDRPRGDYKDRNRNDGPKGGNRPQTFEARPPQESGREKRIDPDNPFAAALMGFKPK
jgi:ATP-dependent RNA helicase SUPV3L1/SUV3